MGHFGVTAFRDAWRRQHPRVFRLGFWYLVGAVSLTALWLAARGVAPDAGLTRSYWYPDGASTEPVVAERTTAVDLAFIGEHDHSTRNYRVRWEGVWFSPRAERLDFYAGADDGVVVRVDGETVLERSPAIGMHTEGRTVALGAGAHRLEIEHWQAGGGQSLNVEWAPIGGDRTLLSPTRLFPADPGALGYWLHLTATRLPGLLVLVWAMGPVVLVALAVWRALYQRATTLSRDEVPHRLRTVLFPAMLGPSQLLLFGPWTVHDTNRAEFLVGFWTLASGWVWLVAPVVGALVALGILLTDRWFPRYVAALWAVGVLLWAQGNLLLAEYGLIDGGGLDLESQAWREPLEASLWIGVLTLGVVFARVVARTAPVASGVLVALQAVALLLPMSTKSTVPGPTGGSSGRAESTWQLPPPAVYELSGARNLIHIVLDAFPSHTFAQILEADRSAFDREWSGFTFFADHLGSHQNTFLSMPAMLSGIAFSNETPFRDFRDRNPTVFQVLGRQGYRVRSLAPRRINYLDRSIAGVDAIRYDIPSPYGSYRDYTDVTAARLLDLSLFRHAPHALKPDIYQNGRWFLQQAIESRRGPEATAAEPFGAAVFLREFAARVTAGDDTPVYSLLHVVTPHLPVVTDADCAYSPGQAPTPEAFRNQARCALSAVGALLQRLRDLDIYDQSAIIVTSDHGVHTRFIGPEEEHPLGTMRTPAGVSLARIQSFATPLLLVKPFATGGPLQISHAPTSITDVPATLLDLAGLPDTLGRGASVVEIDASAPRQRTYAHHHAEARPNRFLEYLYVFSLNGRINDRDAWSYDRTEFGPTDDRAAQRRQHQVGLIASPDDGAQEAGARVYRTERYAVFYAAAETSHVTLDVRRMPAMTASQTVTVRINGNIVGQHVLADDWQTLSYPVEARTEDSPFCIELVTSPIHYDETGESWGLMLRGEM